MGAQRQNQQPLLGLEPGDANLAMARQVHPGAWTNPAGDKPCNLVIIGGGTAGLVVATGAAGLGARVALIEKRFLGGDCLVTGCVPSKSLIRHPYPTQAEVFKRIADAHDRTRFKPWMKSLFQAYFRRRR